MNRVAVAVAVVMVMAGVTLAPVRVEAQSKGEQVYAAQKCATCHSIAGKGAKQGALDGVGSKLSTDEIHQWIVNPAEMTKKTNATRKPPMRAYPKLPKEDLDALVAYMASLKK